MGNFNNLPAFSPYMNHLNSSCYDNEKLIYSKLVNEMTNHFGVKCMYYIVNYNTDYDKLYGEDRDRYVLRKFPLHTFYELPPENDLISRFGIEGLDNFEMYTPKIQFSVASTLLWNDEHGETKDTFDEYTPKAGDIIRTSSNDYFYEILHVKEEEEMFLQTKHTWTFKVRKYRDLHFSIPTSATAVSASLSAYTDQDDMFDISGFIDGLGEDIIITSADAINNGKDPFNGW